MITRWMGLVFLMYLCFPGSALASLEDHLAVYGKDSMSLLVIKPHDNAWQEALSLLPETQTKELHEQLKHFMQALPLENLANLKHLNNHLGTYLSLTYQVSDQGMGEWLFNIDLRADPQTILTHLKNAQQTSFADQIIYSWPVTSPQGPQQMLNMAFINHQILGSLGMSNNALKNMLYRHKLKHTNASSLLHQSPFKPVYQALKQEPLWLYVDSSTLLKHLFQQPEFEGLHFKHQYWLHDLTYYYRGFGLGLKRHKNKLVISHYAAHDLNHLSLFQHQYVQHQAIPTQNIHAMLNRFPPHPILLTTWQNFDLSLLDPWPSHHVLPFKQDLPNHRNIVKWFKDVMSLYLRADILPYLNGPAAFSISPQAKSSGFEETLILGIKRTKQSAFERTLLHYMQIAGQVPKVIDYLEDTALYQISIQQDKSLYYAFDQGQLIISSTLASLKMMLQVHPAEHASFLYKSESKHRFVYINVPNLRNYLQNNTFPLPTALKTSLLKALREFSDLQSVYFELSIDILGQSGLIELEIPQRNHRY